VLRHAGKCPCCAEENQRSGRATWSDWSQQYNPCPLTLEPMLLAVSPAVAPPENKHFHPVNSSATEEGKPELNSQKLL